MVQGQRGQFMARFLSPDVARLVNERGLGNAMQANHLESTIVCCDLRGVSRYETAHTSRETLQVLRVDAPPARTGGRMLSDVVSLVTALREEARVL